MEDAYRALLAKVQSFTDPVSARRHADLTCHAGCSACCEAWLTVNAIEAAAVREGLAELDDASRTRVALRGELQSQRERAGETAARCAMLEDDGTCAIYAQRPLVCRTQGHALRYPIGFIPVAAVRARLPNGEMTHCPLNYTSSAPGRDDVLDAERVDTILAVVDARYTATSSVDPSARHALSELARGR
jgi:hypothetical protein